MFDYLERGDLAVLDRDRDLHRPKARYLVHVASRRRLFLRNQIGVVEIYRLAHRFKHGFRGYRRAGNGLDALHIGVRSRRLARELLGEGRLLRLRAVSFGLVVLGHDDLGNHAVRGDAHPQADLICKALGRQLKDVPDRIVAHGALIDGLDRAVIADQAHHIERAERLRRCHIFLAHEVVAFQRRRRRIRLDAEDVLRIGDHLPHGGDKRPGRNRRAGDRLYLGIDLLRISGEARELALKRFLTDLHAQTGGLLQIADGHAVDGAVRSDTQGDRDRSAISLGRCGHHVADDRIAGLARVERRNLVVLARSLNFLLLKDLRRRQHRPLRALASRQLLLGDRARCDGIGARQRERRNQRKEEEPKPQLHHVTHGSSPPQTTLASSRARSAARRRS